MVNIKITVIKTFSPEEVFGHEYKGPNGETANKCNLKEGQSWETDGWTMPEGFCSWAWEDLRKDRYLLTFGGNLPDTDEGVVFVSCSDGKRPVVFKLERLED
ncbi:MAG: TIGR04076 family protein [Candidatus Thorarchaeota archaeon]|nr:TIGR04076 family protein [Candidatus Thorarchaeota archaeon]